MTSLLTRFFPKFQNETVLAGKNWGTISYQNKMMAIFGRQSESELNETVD